MADSYEASDSSSPEPAASPEKQYRIYNTSGQTLYVVNSEGTIALRPREFYDLPFSKISYHIKLMVRRGFLGLFEKET